MRARLRGGENYAAYDAKVAEYATALADELERFEVPDYLADTTLNKRTVLTASRDGGKLSYARYDLDGNGTEELLFT